MSKPGRANIHASGSKRAEEVGSLPLRYPTENHPRRPAFTKAFS